MLQSQTPNLLIANLDTIMFIRNIVSLPFSVYGGNLYSMPIVLDSPIITDGFIIDSIRGYVEAVSTVKFSEIIIPFWSTEFVIEFSSYCGEFPHTSSNVELTFVDTNKIDFLSFIYKGASIFYKPYFTNSFYFMKTDKDAIPPDKKRGSDSGYDLTFIRKVRENNGISYFDTGIAVKPPSGYYFDLVPRSSLCKLGWTIANNVGIIDSGYRGSIIVALIPLIDSPVKIELPLKAVQLIPRRIYNLEIIEVPTSHQMLTNRANLGGLGSFQFE